MSDGGAIGCLVSKLALAVLAASALLLLAWYGRLAGRMRFDWGLGALVALLLAWGYPLPADTLEWLFLPLWLAASGLSHITPRLAARPEPLKSESRDERDDDLLGELFEFEEVRG